MMDHLYKLIGADMRLMNTVIDEINRKGFESKGRSHHKVLFAKDGDGAPLVKSYEHNHVAHTYLLKDRVDRNDFTMANMPRFQVIINYYGKSEAKAKQTMAEICCDISNENGREIARLKNTPNYEDFWLHNFEVPLNVFELTCVDVDNLRELHNLIGEEKYRLQLIGFFADRSHGGYTINDILRTDERARNRRQHERI